MQKRNKHLPYGQWRCTRRGEKQEGLASALLATLPAMYTPTPRSSDSPSSAAHAITVNCNRNTQKAVRPSATPEQLPRPVYGCIGDVSAVPIRRKQTETLTSRTRARAGARRPPPPLRRRTASRVTAQERKRAPTLPAQALSTAHRTPTPPSSPATSRRCTEQTSVSTSEGRRRRARTFDVWSIASVAACRGSRRELG